MADLHVPLSGLTVGLLGEDTAQVLVDPNWIVSGGSPVTKLRGFYTIATCVVRVTGYRRFGWTFDRSSYSTTNRDGQPIDIRIGYITARAYEAETDHHTTPWECGDDDGIRPLGGTPGDVVFGEKLPELDPANTYYVEMMIAYQTDAATLADVSPVDFTSGMTAHFQTHYQPGEGTADEYGAFHDLLGFVTDDDGGGSFLSFGITEPVLNVAEYGDSNFMLVNHANTEPYESKVAGFEGASADGDNYGPVLYNDTRQFAAVYPNTKPANAENYDPRGAPFAYTYRAVRFYCDRYGYRPVFFRKAHPGMWQAPMGSGGLRDVWQTILNVQDDLQPDINSHFHYRTALANTDIDDPTDLLTQGRWSPHLVIIGSFGNDDLQDCWARLLVPAFLSPDPDPISQHNGQAMKDGAARQGSPPVGIVPILRDHWPSAKVLLVQGFFYREVAGATATGDCPFAVTQDTNEVVEEAFTEDDPDYFGCNPGQTHYGEVAYARHAYGFLSPGLDSSFLDDRGWFDPTPGEVHAGARTHERMATMLYPMLHLLLGTDLAGTQESAAVKHGTHSRNRGTRTR